MLWVEGPVFGALHRGFFVVTSHVDVSINMYLFRKAFPM